MTLIVFDPKEFAYLLHEYEIWQPMCYLLRCLFSILPNEDLNIITVIKSPCQEKNEQLESEPPKPRCVRLIIALLFIRCSFRR